MYGSQARADGARRARWWRWRAAGRPSPRSSARRCWRPPATPPRWTAACCACVTSRSVHAFHLCRYIHEIRLRINLLVLIVVLTSSSTFAFPMTNKKKRANLSTVCIEEQHNKINYRQDIIIMHMSVISMLCLRLI